MSFLDADDRQAALHGYRQMAEQLALFRQACGDNHIPERITDELVQRFFDFIMMSLQNGETAKAVQAAMDGLSEQIQRMAEDDD